MKWLSSRNFNYWFAFLARHRQNPLFAACSSCRVNNILLIWNEKKLLSLEDIFIGTVHYVMMLYSCCSDFVKQQQRNPENWWWRKERRLSQENHCDKFEHQTYSAYCKWKQSLNFHPLSLDSTRFTLFMLITPNFCMTTKSLHCKEGITLEIWYNPTHASTTPSQVVDGSPPSTLSSAPQLTRQLPQLSTTLHSLTPPGGAHSTCTYWVGIKLK